MSVVTKISTGLAVSHQPVSLDLYRGRAWGVRMRMIRAMGSRGGNPSTPQTSRKGGALCGWPGRLTLEAQKREPLRERRRGEMKEGEKAWSQRISIRPNLADKVFTSWTPGRSSTPRSSSSGSSGWSVVCVAERADAGPCQKMGVEVG